MFNYKGNERVCWLWFPYCAWLLLSTLTGAATRLQDLTSACQDAPSKVEKAKQWIRRNDTARAIRELREALESCPQNEQLALELTRAQIAGRQFKQAEEVAGDILKQDARSEEAQFLLADSYFMQQRFPEAGKVLQKLLAQNNDNPDAHKLMGLTFFFYKEYVMSERELQLALKQRPNDEESLYYLGRVYYTQNSFRPAVAAFRRQIALNSEAYKAYDNLGLCYQALGQIPEAVSAFKESQRLADKVDPAYDWPYANLAELLIEQDRAAEALPLAEQALRKNPGSARDHYLAGKALFRGQNLQAALTHLQQAAKLEPDYAEPHYLLGQIFRKLGETAEAQREFAAFEEISAKYPHKKQ